MKKVVVLVFFCLLLSGCFLDPYRNNDYARDAVMSWFSYDKDGSTLGEVRRKQESINDIKNVSCSYVENDPYKRYIFRCNIKFTVLGETVIPLAKDKEINVYVALIYNDDRTYNYTVYNSSYKSGVWLEDENLNYGKAR